MQWAGLDLSRPRVMGIINLTPDSFSDGGRHQDVGAAVQQAQRLISDGADILDLGAESTRPGAVPVTPDQEQDRLMPALHAIREVAGNTPLSIDTRNPETAVVAAQTGPIIWNDVSGLTHSTESLKTAAQLDCPIIIMHSGNHFSDEVAPSPNPVITAHVADWLQAQAARAIDAGVKPEHTALDPGIGFGKSTDDNLSILENMHELTDLNYPILVGASRKRFIGALDPHDPDASNRLGGSIAAHLAAVSNGAHIIRTHDVYATRQAILVWTKIAGTQS